MSIKLEKQGTVDVENCENCEHKMVNLDAKQVTPADLIQLKSEGVRISNPHTDNKVCINCEIDDWRRKFTNWFESDNNDEDYVADNFYTGGSSSDDDDDSGSSGSFGDFGGFGGGSFSGGGASGDF